MVLIVGSLIDVEFEMLLLSYAVDMSWMQFVNWFGFDLIWL